LAQRQAGYFALQFALILPVRRRLAANWVATAVPGATRARAVLY